MRDGLGHVEEEGRGARARRPGASPAGPADITADERLGHGDLGAR